MSMNELSEAELERLLVSSYLLENNIWENREILNWFLVNSSKFSYFDSKVQDECGAWTFEC